MFGLFGKKGSNPSPSPHPPQEEARTAPGTEIRYAPDLINTLKHDHQSLLALYGEIDKAFQEKRYHEVSTMLGEFKGQLHAHLLTENVRLYIYLDRSLAHDPSSSELIRGFRKEMDEIARTALGFLRKYETIGVDEQLASHFDTDFRTIGKVLVERIEKEENTLYPLYLPSY
jgi:hypothetical protein